MAQSRNRRERIENYFKKTWTARPAPLEQPVGQQPPPPADYGVGVPNLGRKWWVAAALALIAAGLGQVYNGQLRKAVFYLAAPFGLLVLSFLVLSFGANGLAFFIPLAAAFIVRAGSVVDAIVSARQQSVTYELKSCNRFVVYGAMCGIAFLVAHVIRVGIVEAFWIPSGAMLPTIQIGDRLFVNKLAYGMHLPLIEKEITQWRPLRRDDIIVFTSPVDHKTDLIKRIIAVEGDSLEIRNKHLYINGQEVPEPHASFTDPHVRDTAPRDNFGPVTVPPGKVFVMGDNRDQSYDSRYWGFAGATDVKGKATFIYWSWNSGTRWVRWGRLGSYLR